MAEQLIKSAINKFDVNSAINKLNINSAINKLDINSAINKLDINPVLANTTDTIRKTYENTRYYIRILLITSVVLILLCIMFSCITSWANYKVITNQTSTNEILHKIETSEKHDKPVYEYTYQSKYNYDSLGEIEQLIYSEYTKAYTSGIRSLILEDINIENENYPFRMDVLADPNTPSPLMVNLVRDSWLSASNSQYILNKSNTNRIVADFFVENKDKYALKSFLNSNTFDNTYQIDVPNSDLILIFRFNLYERDNRNRFFHRILPENPGSIAIDEVVNPHIQKIKGVGNIRTFKRLETLADTKKPYLFYYWQNEDNKKTPVHISLAHKTIEKHCSKSFRLTKLDDNNILDYLPELKPYRKRLDTFKICHRVDIYRIYLLYKYGGLYIDSDTVILKDLIDLIAPLDTSSDKEKLRIEYIGYGCTGKICKDTGYMRPSNGLMGARKGSFLMHDIKQNIFNLIFANETSSIDPNRLLKNDNTYFTIGKRLIWSMLDNFTKSHKYTYFHIDQNILGIRDKDGYWVTNGRLFDTKKIEYTDENSMYLVIFYNSEFRDPELMRTAKESDILNSNMQIARFFRRALK